MARHGNEDKEKKKKKQKNTQFDLIRPIITCFIHMRWHAKKDANHDLYLIIA